MTRKIEKTFEVSVPVERVWSAMTDPEELNRWYFPFTVDDDGTTHIENRGVDQRSEVVEVEPLRKIRTRSEHLGTGDEPFPSPPAGVLEMTVMLQVTETGTRVVITHSGFGEGEDWATLLEAMSLGTDETIADLVLYLTTGVGFPRHPSERSFHGVAWRQRVDALEVTGVAPDSFAERLGLQSGDVLVELGGAAVFGMQDVAFFTREHGPGETVDAAWIRDGKLMRGKAELGVRPTMAAKVTG